MAAIWAAFSLGSEGLHCNLFLMAQILQVFGPHSADFSCRRNLQRRRETKRLLFSIIKVVVRCAALSHV